MPHTASKKSEKTLVFLLLESSSMKESEDAAMAEVAAAGEEFQWSIYSSLRDPFVAVSSAAHFT